VTHITFDDAAYWRDWPPVLAAYEEALRDTTARVAWFTMGEPDADPPTAVVLDLGPGEVIPRHAHGCERFEIIVRGTLDVGDRILGPGDVMRARAGEVYGPHVAGPEGCTTCEFFTSFEQAYKPIMELPDGSYGELDFSQPEVFGLYQPQSTG
jgi:hypothetical protein